ncbi:MAG: butyrate kinase [Treponema sp.]|nr:butyrate kinase [Treponema sp.]
MKNLILNPGSTSTKIAVFDENTMVFSKTIRHLQEELEEFSSIIEQKEFRSQTVIEACNEQGIDLADISAVIAIGGLLHAGVGGVYEVNDMMIRDLTACTYGEHAANLGGLLAAEIAHGLKIKAYIADPVTTDELQDVARLSGLPEIERSGKTHTLNQKAAARQAAEELGNAYESCNLVVAHLGGGISIAAHRDGLIVETNDPRGEGPFCMDRAGGVSILEFAKLCYSGKYTRDEMLKRVNGNSGVAAYMNTRDFLDVENLYLKGDPQAIRVFNALAYQVAKEIGATVAVLRGKVDAIVFTGGMSKAKIFIDEIRGYIESFGKILVYPGEFELEALASYAVRVQKGEIEAHVYKGASA